MERHRRAPVRLHLPSLAGVAAVVLLVGLVRTYLAGGPVDGVLRFVAWATVVATTAWMAPRRPIASPALGAALGVALLFLVFGLTWTQVTAADTPLGQRFAELSAASPPWGALLVIGLTAAAVTGGTTALLAWAVSWLRKRHGASSVRH